MYVLKKFDEYDSFANFTDDGNEDINIILRYLLLSIPGGVLLLSLSLLWTLPKPFFN